MDARSIRFLIVPWIVIELGCGFQPNPDKGAVGVDGNPAQGDSAGSNNNGSGGGGPSVRRIDVAGTKVIGGPHTDFPVLVALTTTWLRGTAAGGEVTSAAGYDITFSADQAGTTRLAHELERYRGDTGELVAWVKLPSLSTATSFYIHDGDPAITSSQENRPGVWSAGYAGVWHLSSMDDATTQNPATNSGSTATGAKIADGRAFDGAGNLLSVASSASVDDVFAAGGTAEAWFSATGWGGNNLGRLFDKGSGSTVAIGMCDANVSSAFLFGHSFNSGAGNWCTPQGSLALNTWTHVAVVYDSSSSANVPTIYIDGIAMGLSTISSASGSPRSDAGAALTLGDRTGTGRGFAGSIDEARLSRVARSAGWIATAYANQQDPSTFCVVAP